MIRVQREDLTSAANSTISPPATIRSAASRVLSEWCAIWRAGPHFRADARTLSRDDREEAGLRSKPKQPPLAAVGIADRPPLRPARTGRPHRAGCDRLAAREAALAACHFLIDWLKTDAPFWKKRGDAARRALGPRPAREDDEASRRWREYTLLHTLRCEEGRDDPISIGLRVAREMRRVARNDSFMQPTSRHPYSEITMQIGFVGLGSWAGRWPTPDAGRTQAVRLRQAHRAPEIRDGARPCSTASRPSPSTPK